MKFPRFNRLLILAMITLGHFAAANTTDLSFANGSGGEAVFSIEQPDSMFIPYGEYPHRQGLQLFDKVAADGMVTAHNSVIGKVKRLVGMSYPVYVGHPDLPGSKDSDKRAYGWVEGMTAENDGLRLAVKWSEEGRKMVENAHYKFYSPFWYLAKAANGKGYRPKSLISVGLTNSPNIPVPALANESEPDETVPVPADPKLIEALGLAEDATIDDVVAAIAALTAKKPEDEADKVPAEELAAEKTAKEAAENALATAKETITGLEAKLKKAANDAVQVAVTAGRLTPAESAAKVTEILAANDVAAALRSLRELAVKVKSTSAVGDLGAAKVQVVTAANDEAKARREGRAVAVANEYERTSPRLPEGDRRRIAHTRAAEKNPDLFSNKSPETAA